MQRLAKETEELDNAPSANSLQINLGRPLRKQCLAQHHASEQNLAW